ncbi:MAG: Flp family type IVb pilin [Rhodospirillales bacterium]|jgi:Flp pilus assembly pilin Flp|nr:Flp family type IVb pilin [Rhodospirillales bacterium]
MQDALNRFLRDEAGHDQIEYGLLAVLIAVSLVALLAGLGTTLSDWFTTVSGEVANAAAVGG